MMGLGSFGNGGSTPPPSNLSALAPPFSVDRSNPKPNSNPHLNFSEPPYAVPLHSSFPNWQYPYSSAAPTPDFYPSHGSEVDSIRTTCLPSASSPDSHMPPLNPNFSDAASTFTFLQYSNDIPSTHVGAKSYYSPFVSPVIEDDTPLVALNEPSYDSLSTSRGPLDASVRVDYNKSLSGLEYMPQWGSSWKSQLSGGEQGKRVGPDGRFCSEEKNIAGSHVYKNYMKQGAFTGEGLHKCEEASAVLSRKYIDVLGTESQTVSPSAGKLNDKVQHPRFISGDSSRTLISDNSKLPESHAQGLFPEPAANFWNHQMSYGASYDKCFQPLDSFMNDFLSTKKSSPTLVIRPPSVGTTRSREPSAVPSEGINIGSVAAINRNDFGFRDPSNKKESRLPPSYGKEGCVDSVRPSLHVEKNDHFFVASFSSRKEELANKPVTKNIVDYTFKTGPELQLPDTNVAGGFIVALDRAKGFATVDSSSESLDHYNLAEDSPCWKGAPASHLSPSESSDAVTPPQHLLKKLEACDSLNLQETLSFSPCTDDTVKVYQANGYVELGSLLCPEKLSNANCPARQHGTADAVKAGVNYPNLISYDGVQCSSEIDKPRKEYDVPNDSKSVPGLKPAHTEQLGLKKAETSEGEFKLYAGVVADTGSNNDATADSVPYHGMEGTSCLPCSPENVNTVAKTHATESTPKMNVQIVVNTIHSLSELLLSHCSNDASAITEQHHEALKHVIHNLDCVSKKVAHMTPKGESVFPGQGTSHEPDFHKGVTAGRSPVTKEADASSHGWLDHHCPHEGKRNINTSGKEVEKIPDFVSLRGDADIMKDDKMVQAIKELLKEDFNGEEEMQSETLLYKNLWLEAEAALCSVSYKARFNRIKVEMEKRKSHNMKDDAETTKAAEKLPILEVSPDPNLVHKVTPEAKDGPISNSSSIQNSPISSTPKIDDKVEASVMARFDILKRRGQGSTSAYTEGQRLTEVVDAGFADKMNHLPPVEGRSEDGSSNGSDEFHSQHSGGNSKIDEFGPYIGSSQHGYVKQLRVHGIEDQVVRSGKNTRMGSRILSGWCESSSSDWEHVLKDEYAGQN